MNNPSRTVYVVMIDDENAEHLKFFVDRLVEEKQYFRSRAQAFQRAAEWTRMYRHWKYRVMEVELG